MFSISKLLCIYALIQLIAKPSPAHSKKYQENEICGGLHGFPTGTCQLATKCTTLKTYYEKKWINPLSVPSCGFKGPFGKAMLCCPKPFEDLKEGGSYNFTGTHLVTMRYFKNENRDEYAYRCTGVLLSSSHVLASKQCDAEEDEDIASKVKLGSQDARVIDESDIKIDVKKPTSYKNDLVLIKLRTALNTTQLTENVSIAKLCHPEDLTGHPNFFAAGYSYNTQENESCTKFTMQLQNLNLKECNNVKVTRQIEDLATDQSHFCLLPLPIYKEGEECSKCLIATSSVLHVERMDGTQCVAGIATPTYNKCIEEDSPLYFTNILTHSVSDFFNHVIVE
ncbi:uncharacterized protein LOC133848607 [Drosophila sulfurigaster albostrigata]|uniref:uncharacterized protein LOC133848607 n=1 Tax=Drosophila sulfurigaster albostrigata TaxID=89887 RepID=UPI002D21E108|nr:uncharacterized protein LOC133848607 [Drosophila sulfurigaster albostrigata]